MRAGDIMTREVVTVAPQTRLAEAVRLMLHHRVSGVPVVDQGALVGILTEGDLLRRAETGTQRQRPAWLDFLRGPGQLADDYVRTHGRSVDEVMTRAVLTVAEDAPLEAVVDLMETRQIKRVPVLANGRLAGVVSRADLLRALSQALWEPATPAADDATLHALVLAELRRHIWGGRGQVSVEVAQGTATLRGFVSDPRARDAMRVAAENVPGVRAVAVELVYFDPNSGMIY